MKRFVLTVAALFNFLGAPAANATEVAKCGPAIKLATWNIQVGSERGAFENGWKLRKEALIPAIKAVDADILCTQEGRLEQLQWIDRHFPKYARVGVGRDDGRNGGEFCAIYYLSERFEMVKSGTFWLSDTPNSSNNTWDGPYKRICTHALFKDKKSGAQFAVLSTHFPLIPTVQPKAAHLIVERMQKYFPDIPTFLCGDFNCQPGSEPWKIFEASKLQSSDAKQSKTYHVDGAAVSCLDAIFRSPDTKLLNCKVLNGKYLKRYPSDHFGLVARVVVVPEKLQ